MTAKKVLVILAPGAEEMETVISVDVLRRGGLEVVLAGIDGEDPVLCSRNVKICPDTSLVDARGRGPYDCILLPGGGEGAEALGASKEVGEMLGEQDREGRMVAAVCAAAFKGKLESAGYKYMDEMVVVDKNIVTSRGPGTSFRFALEIVKILVSQEKREEVSKAMLVE